MFLIDFSKNVENCTFLGFCDVNFYFYALFFKNSPKDIDPHGNFEIYELLKLLKFLNQSSEFF